MAAVKRSLNVGVVGMGNMGVSITRNLAFKARSAMYLQIHSRSLTKARKVCDDIAVDGATCAMRLHDKYSTMTKWCDVMLLTLRDVEASRMVLLEHPDAIVRNARNGQIIVDHTTVDVETSRECEHEAKKRGALFLDAPISGSPRAAFNGQLTLMVGGDRDAYQKCVPVFRMYGDQIHHLGGPGSGSAAKCITQALVAIHNTAAAEALKLSHELGVENYETLLRVLDASWGSSTMLRRNAPTMQELIRNPDRVPPTSSATIDSLLSDLRLLRDSGSGDDAGREQRRGSAGYTIDVERYPLLHSSIGVLESASHAGVGDRDMASVIHFLDAQRHAAASVSSLQVQGVGHESAGATDRPLEEGSGSHDPAVDARREEEVEFY